MRWTPEAEARRFAVWRTDKGQYAISTAIGSTYYEATDSVQVHEAFKHWNTQPHHRGECAICLAAKEEVPA